MKHVIKQIFMKKFLISVSLALACLASEAQNMEGDYKPHVNIITRKGHEHHDDNARAIRNAAKIYEQTHVGGFQQSHKPNYIFSSHDNRFMIALGGYVNTRVAYDMKGIVDDTDFVTYDIPTAESYATRQKLTMDATTSRLFVKAIAVSRTLGNIVTYIETDFRGYRGDLRLRLAYISFKGFMFGRNITTFCDLDAGPNTVDFQGPNSYSVHYSTMIRYVLPIGKHWSIAAAAEMPSLSATYPAELFSGIPQRVPDFPVYVQYRWSKRNPSHIRFSAIFRDMYYHAEATGKNMAQFGWGVQLSGNVRFARRVNLMFNGIYGEGITPYIQDLSGSGLDLVPRNTDRLSMQTLPMFGFFAAAQVNITPRTFISGGYSWVKVDSGDKYRTENLYKDATYIFCNIFHNLTSSCKIAVEYLHGIRQDVSGAEGSANRVQAMIQYNF